MSREDKPLDYQARNRLWQPETLQEQLAQVSVIIGGMGGLGWHLGSALIGLGVKHLTIFDPDTLETTNLNRLWGCRVDDVGQPKVDIFKRMALSTHHDLMLTTHQQAIPTPEFERALKQADVIFGGYDRPEPRLATQLLSLKYNTPYIDAGVALQSTERGFRCTGQVFTSIPEASRLESGCIVCSGLRQGSIGYRGEGGIAPDPSSSIPNAILANLSVSTWVQYLQGETAPTLRVFNWNQMSIEPIESIDQRADCPICGPNPDWKKLVDIDDAELSLS